MFTSWLRAFVSFISFILLMYLGYHHNLVQYLMMQAYGQLSIIALARPVAEYADEHRADTLLMQKLDLVRRVKIFSVDSLGYMPTDNFEKIYDPAPEKELMWVVAASKPDTIEEYQWQFPLIGAVGYKGFFSKSRAVAEFNHLRAGGYDAELYSPAAWSTLGWFNDPIVVSVLERSKGQLCNLVFHELFHATYYAPGDAVLNENLAVFVAHEATKRFLRNDTTALKKYLDQQRDDDIFEGYMQRKTKWLNLQYASIRHDRDLLNRKHRALVEIADSIHKLNVKNRVFFSRRSEALLRAGNAYFTGFSQYHSKLDSLQKVFNKFYRGDLKKMVQHLRKV